MVSRILISGCSVIAQCTRNSAKCFRSQSALLTVPTAPANSTIPAIVAIPTRSGYLANMTVVTAQELSEKISTELQSMDKTSTAVSNPQPLMGKKTNTPGVVDGIAQAATIKAGREAFLRTKYYAGFHEGKYGQKYFDEALRKALEEAQQQQK